MQKSIRHYTDLDGDNCIYKFSGASSLWAALGDGENALKWLNRSLELLPRFGTPPQPARIPTLTANTFYSERENPTFESPISASRCMLDMLLQDWGSTIRVFPAMPAKWKDASFHNLLAEGAFLVSAVLKNGKTEFIRIKSLAGEPCRVKTDLPGEIKCIGPSSVHMHQENGMVGLGLKKGEEVILYAGRRPETFVISALPVRQEEMNSWGERTTIHQK